MVAAEYIGIHTANVSSDQLDICSRQVMDLDLGRHLLGICACISMVSALSRSEWRSYFEHALVLEVVQNLESSLVCLVVGV